MMTLRQVAGVLVVTVMAAMCGACAAWPEQRGGGAAEMTWTETETDSANAQALAAMVEACGAAITMLREAGADKAMPATMARAEVTLIRSHREVHAGLYLDADRGLEALATTLAEVATTIDRQILHACVA